MFQKVLGQCVHMMATMLQFSMKKVMHIVQIFMEGKLKILNKKFTCQMVSAAVRTFNIHSVIKW